MENKSLRERLRKHGDDVTKKVMNDPLTKEYIKRQQELTREMLKKIAKRVEKEIGKEIDKH